MVLEMAIEAPILRWKRVDLHPIIEREKAERDEVDRSEYCIRKKWNKQHHFLMIMWGHRPLEM